jgi:hypothetical protein
MTTTTTELSMRPGATKPRKRGIELVRRLDPEESSLLVRAFEALREGMPASTREIHWVNLYLNGALTVDHHLREALHAWVTRIVAEVYADWPEVHLITYSFIVNPAGSQEGQPFHCDYAPTSSNLFVPLTEVSVRNATQFIRQPLQRTVPNERVEYGTLEDILDAEGWDAVEVTQLVPRPFTLLRLLPGTPHRGIGNGEDYDRVMFCVTLDVQPHVLEESVYFKYSSREYASIHEG